MSGVRDAPSSRRAEAVRTALVRFWLVAVACAHHVAVADVPPSTAASAGAHSVAMATAVWPGSRMGEKDTASPLTTPITATRTDIRFAFSHIVLAAWSRSPLVPRRVSALGPSIDTLIICLAWGLLTVLVPTCVTQSVSLPLCRQRVDTCWRAVARVQPPLPG